MVHSSLLNGTISGLSEGDIASQLDAGEIGLGAYMLNLECESSGRWWNRVQS